MNSSHDEETHALRVLIILLRVNRKQESRNSPGKQRTSVKTKPTSSNIFLHPPPVMSLYINQITVSARRPDFPIFIPNHVSFTLLAILAAL